MKRVLCFLLSLIIISSSLVAFTAYALIRESDNVTFTLIDEWGDNSLLEGITSEMQFTHHNQLNWTVEFYPTGETKTKYDYNTFHNSNGNSSEYHGFSYPYINLSDLRHDNPELQKIFNELFAEEYNPGDIKRRTIYFSDIYDYYPVNFDLSLPGISISWTSGNFFDEKGEYVFSGITPSRGKELLKTFNDYFRIPVNNNDIREISIHWGDDGNFSWRTANRNTFGFNFFNVLADDCIYFTFPNEINTGHNEVRQLIDTSEIHGGYGIYALPYTENDIKSEELKTVYSIPADATVEALSLNEKRNELYLGLHENEKFVLHVIDIATMTDKTVLELFDIDFHDYIRVEQDENFFVFIKNDIEYNVVEISPDGTIKSSLEGTVSEETATGMNYISSDSSFGFDGKRLVILLIKNPLYDDQSSMTIQPEISVFTKDGLSYYGKWVCSLAMPHNNFASPFVFQTGKNIIRYK